MLFSLHFGNNTISSCFVFFIVIIDLYFLIPAVIAQIFNPIAALVISIEILIKEAKAEMETINNGQYNSKLYKFQKQLSRGVFDKRCSENMQKIYRRTAMPKCDFNNVAK